MLTRHPQNPLIRPQQVKPSQAGFEVIGTFNCGATLYQNEVILLVRVAEKYPRPGKITSPHLGADGTLIIEEIDPTDPQFDMSDPRVIRHRTNGEVRLTSLSHLRIARSTNGVDFQVEDAPWLIPSTPMEGYGIEDGRITQIDDTYYINYSAVSRYGIATGLVTTQDFKHYTRQGMMFPPSNRDVVIFPQKINDLYVCYHRPMPGAFGGYHIWMATSPDLCHWGQHQVVLEAKPDGWESGRVGGGAPPIYTERGWLSIYHAADRQDHYCLGAFLTAHDNPGQIIAYSPQPIFSPVAPYETTGFFGNVVFTCGAVVQGDLLRIYYGAADETIALAEIRLPDLLEAITWVK